MIDNDVLPLSQSQAPNELLHAPVFEVTNELKGLQERMTNLFMRQKSRGGIIDLDADDNNVISIDSEDEVLRKWIYNLTLYEWKLFHFRQLKTVKLHHSRMQPQWLCLPIRVVR